MTGQVVLVVSAFMAATAGGDDRAMLVASLFLLGFGWNLGFVAGSAYLTEGVPERARVSLEGLADTVVWTSSAVASLSSGILLEATSYTDLEPSCRGGGSLAGGVARPLSEPAHRSTRANRLTVHGRAGLRGLRPLAVGQQFDCVAVHALFDRA